ncbi:restriction endonuclease subunit S [Paraburkholderia terricola]|jgi:type I restriction enzyme S subunit|uniref:restriction endonuclease subunit S n=1 Tax=Paraburkholderia terricola TaxID=169427 RepID=UPI000DEF1144|nr:restriction endonuclease subunit S [Paraburkholderia terricola]AXE91076.1 hypothetical protein CUJ90_00930 [Paraburkholderia terricola]
MDAQQFLAEFGHIADAPGGVARLRELVLHLAVSGKLSNQTPGEQACDFLEEINATRQALQADGAIRVNRKVRSASDSGNWVIPANWIWCRFGELCSFSAGRTPSRKEGRYWNSGGYPWFSIADLKHGQVVATSNESVSDVARLEVFKGAPSPAGSLLMSFKLSIGKLSVLGVDAYHNEAIVTIDPFSAVLKEYFFKCLNGFDLAAGNKAAIKGSTLNKDSLSNIFIALPPKNEIPRIVAKVDELMVLCDRLEMQQKDRRKLQNTLRQSTLEALASAQSTYELKESWERLQSNFEFLFGEPADVRLLRDMLFDLALRGVLLAESKLNASDESSREDRRPLPDGWEWKTLADLSEYITSGSRGWKAYLSSTGDSFIRSQDIRQDALVFENPAFVSLPERVEGKRTLVRPGDLLLTITGGNVGRCAVVPGLSNSAYVSQHVALIRLQKTSLSEFIHCWMINAFGGRAFLAQYIYGDKPGLNLVQVGSVPIPVPPAHILPEILTTLRRHRQLCDAFAQQLKAKSDVAGKLCSAAIASLTGISIEQNVDTSVKAPQTELNAPLRLSTSPDVKAHAPLAKFLARNNGEMQARDLWQRFGGEIDAFYAQLNVEVAHGWIAVPAVANVREKAAEAAEG